jgi:hypothetical protein
MTFRIERAGEPVINGWTHRPASWPTREAAQAWIDYWARLWASLGGDRCQIIEHTKESDE